MTRDPLEGIATDGTIVTGASRARVPPRYESCLAHAAERIQDIAGETATVLLYGSVATGQATSPRSDVDLLVIAIDPPLDALDELSRVLSAEHSILAREIAITTCARSVLDEDSPEGVGMRCFARHYCVHIAGPNVIGKLEPCTASPDIAWSFNHDIAERVEKHHRAIDEAPSRAVVEGTCEAAARDLLLASTSLASILGSTWTTDRLTAARLLSEHHPEWTNELRTLVDWMERPSAPQPAVRRMLDTYGAWLVDAMARHAPSPIRDS